MSRTSAVITVAEEVALQGLNTAPNSTIIYKDGTGAVTGLTVGTNLSVSGGALNATGGGGSGDVVGPSSATDNAIARFDTTTGKLIQNSSASVDDNGNISGNNVKGGFTSTATAGATTTLTIASTQTQEFTGTLGQTVAFPDTATVAKGLSYRIINNSTGSLSIVTSTSQPIVSLSQYDVIDIECTSNAGNTGTEWAYTPVQSQFIQTGGIQSITGLKTFTKDKLAMKGTSTGTNVISVANASGTSYTNTIPAKTGTFAMTSDITGTNSGTNTGDQTSIVGITGTIAQFNTACTDADFATGGGTATGSNTGDNATNTQYSGLAASKLDAQFAVDINRQGFLNTTQTSISFSGTTFTLTDVGAGWSYYRAGIKYTISGTKTVALSAATAGAYYIYIDATDGTLTCSAVNTPWSLLDTKVPVASVTYNSTLTPTYWLADERHTALIDQRMEYYLHATAATKLISTPTLSGYTLNSDTNATKTFAITSGIILDQDLRIDVASLTQPNGTATDYVVWYRTAASTWAWKASNMPFVYNVGNTNDWIQYDNAGTMTDLTGGAGGLTRWANSYLLITNKQGASRFIIVPGRAVFTSLALAQAESVNGFSWAGFEVDEAVVCYRLTWTTVTSTSQGKCRLAATPQLINISSTTNASSGAGTDHNTLSNLQGGTTGEYNHLTNAELAVVQATSGTNTGNQTSIVGITGTFAQFNTAVTDAELARTDAANTFTGVQTYTQIICTNNSIAASGNAATVPVTYKTNTITNNSAATLTVTLTTAGAVDRQLVEVIILDFSAVAQTITWVNTENSTVTAPVTSNGSTTLPLSVIFQYNNATSKWRTVGFA